MQQSSSRRVVQEDDAIEVVVYDITGGRRHLILPTDGVNHSRLLGKGMQETGPVTYQGSVLGCQIAEIIPPNRIEERSIVTPHISLSREEAGRFYLERDAIRRTKRLVSMPGFSRQTPTAASI